MVTDHTKRYPFHSDITASNFATQDEIKMNEY